MSPRKPLRLVLAAWLAGLIPAAAFEQAGLEIGRLEAGPVVLENLSAVFRPGGPGGADLHVFAAAVTISSTLHLKRFEIHCEGGDLGAAGLACPAGGYRVEHPSHGEIRGRAAFEWDAAGGALSVALSDVTAGDTVIAGRGRYAPGGWRLELAATRLALSALRDLAAPPGYWPAGYSDESGSADVALRAAGTDAGVDTAEAVVRLRGAGFYGPNSAENLDLEAEVRIDTTAGVDIRAGGKMLGGAVYIEPGLSVGGYRPGVALEAAEPVSFAVDASWDPETRRLIVRNLSLDHPGVVSARARADMSLGENFEMHDAEVEVEKAAAGAFYATWLQPFLLHTRFSALEAAGTFHAGAIVRDNELEELDLRFDDVHAYDGDERFFVAGLDGNLRITAAAERRDSTLSWDGIGIYRLELGAGELSLASSGGDVEVVRWRDVPILDGALRIDALSIEDAGGADMAVMLDGGLTAISMADFTQSLGWPVMTGELTGVIDGLTWRRGTLTVGGAINVGLFDGSVVVRNLRVDDLFGLVPALYADIDVNDVDLALVTERFSFGRIEGRLGGYIHNLSLQAWQPVYFEAELATPEDDDSRHRISQQAVDNLGYLGGGASSALSGGFLQYFREYSYGRLGISCRLYNGACELGGVEDTEDGFLILTRGGLLPPWIEVKGTGRTIEWNTLVEGLKTITSNRPEIR